MSEPCPAGCNAGLINDDICATCNGSGEARPARRKAKGEVDVDGPFAALRMVLDARAPELVPLVERALELQLSGGLAAVRLWLAEVEPLSAEEHDRVMDGILANMTPEDAAQEIGVAKWRWERLYAETPALRGAVAQKQAEAIGRLERMASNGDTGMLRLLAILRPEKYAPKRKG